MSALEQLAAKIQAQIEARSDHVTTTKELDSCVAALQGFADGCQMMSSQSFLREAIEREVN